MLTVYYFQRVIFNIHSKKDFEQSLELYKIHITYKLFFYVRRDYLNNVK